MAGKYDNLQALRGAACLLVVVFHIAGVERAFGLSFAPFRPLLWFGFAGVDLFFVLSGFIIAATNRDRTGQPAAVPGYLFRRAWRVYPVCWAALGLASIQIAHSNPEGFASLTTSDVIDQLLLIPSAKGLPLLLPVSWSMSFEIMFYLAFVAVLVLPRRAGWGVMVAWAGTVLWATLTGTAVMNRFAGQFLSPFVLEFLAGVLIAYLPLKLSFRTATALFVAAGVWFSLGLWAIFQPDPMIVPQPSPRTLAMGIPSALIVLAAVGRERGGGRVRNRLLTRLGDASYSIYLIHLSSLSWFFFVTMYVRWPHNRTGHVAWLAGALVASVLPGVLLHIAVERPLMRSMKGRRVAPGPVKLAAPQAPTRLAA
jgi:exopolysaccharide production protein ExoZ